MATLTVGAAEPEKCISMRHTQVSEWGIGGGKGSEEEKQQQIAAGTEASIFDEWGVLRQKVLY